MMHVSPPTPPTPPARLDTVRSPGHAASSHGVVTSAFPDASAAGVAALRAGGNAIDAACAAAWALCVCEPGESGLGGQTTMLVRFADGRCLVVDGHSRAPLQVTRKNVGRRAQERGIRSTTIPSTPATLASVQRRFGRLTLAQALAPAIALAEEGYLITRLQRRLLKWTAPHFAAGSPEAALFMAAGGTPFRVGDRFRQPALGATLRRLSLAGVDDFYTGQIACEIVADMTARGGLITAEDLKHLHLPVDREPLEIEYRGHKMMSLPPPGGGVQTLLALRVLEHLTPTPSLVSNWVVPIALATLAAFRERERWPDHPADMTPSLAKWLVSAQRAHDLAADIAKRRDPPPAPLTDSFGESGNTTHLCAADTDGMIVSLTQSIQSVFGAKVAHPTLGFVYNNYLSACPRTKHPHRLGPGSLPQSNAAPTIVLHPSGSARLALGSAGSRRITSSIVQVISGVIDAGLSLVDALRAPRAHALLSGTVWLEQPASPATQAALNTRVGHVRLLPKENYKLGAVQALAWDESGAVHGAADPRRDGHVAVA